MNLAIGYWPNSEIEIPMIIVIKNNFSYSRQRYYSLTNKEVTIRVVHSSVCHVLVTAVDMYSNTITGGRVTRPAHRT